MLLFITYTPHVEVHDDRRAIKHGYKYEDYPADWDRFGRAAGPIRNKQMLDEGKPTLVIAVHEDISKSKGTKNMVEQAEKRGIDVLVVGANE